MFFFASLSSFTFELIGKLMFSELLSLFSFNYFQFRKNLKKNKLLKTIFSAFIALFFATLISDIYNQVSIQILFKGISLIIFSFFSTYFVFKSLLKSENNIYVFLLASSFFSFFFYSDGTTINLDKLEENSNYFKSHIIPFVIPLILAITIFLHRVQKKVIVFFFLFLFGLLSIFLDGRSTGLVFIFSSILYIFKNQIIKFNKVKTFLYLLILVSIFYLSYLFYIDLIIDESIGGINSKTQIQLVRNPKNPLELLLVGRSEIVTLYFAILDKPIFGHGSWATDIEGKYSALASIVTNSTLERENVNIPAHSVLLGYWAYGGIIAFFAIFYMFYNLLKTSLKIFFSKNFFNFLPYLIYLTIEMTWSFFFSPIGVLRLTIPIYAGVIIYFNLKHENIRNESNLQTLAL